MSAHTYVPSTIKSLSPIKHKLLLPQMADAALFSALEYMLASVRPGTELQLVWQAAHVPVPTSEYTAFIHAVEPGMDDFPSEHDAQLEEPELAE